MHFELIVQDIVTGGRCDFEENPCLLASSDDGNHWLSHGTSRFDATKPSEGFGNRLSGFAESS
jgi:hypothetical protein